MYAQFLVLILILSVGCTHRIDVNPLPSNQATTPIPRVLHLIIDTPALEGADHRPGITLLEWPQENLDQAILQYVEHRHTFDSVSANQGNLTLHITTKLVLTSRKGRYHYQIHLHAEMREEERPVKTYLAEATVPGSLARWVTASDRDPTNAAIQMALDDLFTQIEQDRSRYVTGHGGSDQP